MKIDLKALAMPESDPPEAEALDFPTREAWLAARRLSIGASDAPAVLGLTPSRTPLAVYLDKLGIVDPDDVSEPSEAMRWGTLLEGVIRRETEARVLRDVVYVPHRIHRSRTIPYLTATLDGLLPDTERGPGVLEIKTAHRAVEDGEEAPLAYQVQVQHQLLVTGCVWGIIAVLYGGQRLVTYPVERNPNAIRLLREEHALFWQRVQDKNPPPLDGTRASAELLRALYPRERAGASIVLPQDAIAWDEVYVQTTTQISALEKRRDEAKHHLQNYLADAEIGLLPDGSGRYSWKTQSRVEYVVPGWVGRVFRRHAPKEANGS